MVIMDYQVPHWARKNVRMVLAVLTSFVMTSAVGVSSKIWRESLEMAVFLDRECRCRNSSMLVMRGRNLWSFVSPGRAARRVCRF